MKDERFEWDDVKAAANRRNHGIGFQEAVTIFEDPMALTQPDTHHSDTEDREVTLRYSEVYRMLMVVHTDRGLRKRIISARRATKVEMKVYFLPR